MDKDTAWSMFESTGNVEAYMLYRDLADEETKVVGQEDCSDADQNRRPGNPGI